MGKFSNSANKGIGAANQALQAATLLGTFITKAKTYQDHRKNGYSITLSQSSPLFNFTRSWITTQIPAEKQRNLEAQAYNSHSPVLALFKAGSTHWLDMGGFRIQVRLVIPESSNVAEVMESRDTDAFKPRLVFSCETREGQTAILAKLDELNKTRLTFTKVPELNMYTTHFGWSHSGKIRRQTESVILKEGQMDAIIADMKSFLSREQEYLDRGIPWHRGYLFHGPPGTGKTSIAQALAVHFNMDLNYLSLSSISNDQFLAKAVIDGTGGITMMEDIDIFGVSNVRENNKSDDSVNLTLSGLLNILDGAQTPHGMISIMSTNDINALDPALIRPGRIDRIEKLDYVDQYQLDNLFKIFYGREAELPLIVRDKMTPAMVLEIFKRHMDDPQIAEKVLSDG